MTAKDYANRALIVTVAAELAAGRVRLSRIDLETGLRWERVDMTPKPAPVSVREIAGTALVCLTCGFLAVSMAVGAMHLITSAANTIARWL